MLKKDELLRLIVELISINDADLLAGPRVHESLCSVDDRPLLSEIVGHVASLRDAYDFRHSSRFASIVRGKSDQYQLMAQRLEADPIRKQKRLAELDVALGEVLHSSAAFELLPADNHDQIRMVVDKMNRLLNES